MTFLGKSVVNRNMATLVSTERKRKRRRSRLWKWPALSFKSSFLLLVLLSITSNKFQVWGQLNTESDANVTVLPALELSLNFSIWYPGYDSFDVMDDLTQEIDGEQMRFVELVLDTLRQFLCEINDTNRSSLVLQEELDLLDSRAKKSFCAGVEGHYNHHFSLNLLDNIFDLTNSTTTVSLVSYATKLSPGTILVSDQRDNGIQWTAWEVSYHVIQVGKSVAELADDPEISYAMALSGFLQGELDASIEAGTMDERLETVFGSSRPRMSKRGQEFATFEDEWLRYVNEKDYTQAARVLRFIGYALFSFNLTILFIFSILARRNGAEQSKQAQSSSKRGSPETDVLIGERVDVAIGLLESEVSVNQMLMIGRTESMKAMAGKSNYLKVSNRSKPVHIALNVSGSTYTIDEAEC